MVQYLRIITNDFPGIINCCDWDGCNKNIPTSKMSAKQYQQLLRDSANSDYNEEAGNTTTTQR